MYQEVFNQFMKLMKPFMKSHGFTTRGNNFYKRHPQGNIGIVNFQKSSKFCGEFYINVSIYSCTLAEFFLGECGEKEVRKYPSEYHGHWRSRIESLVPKESPYYGNISDCWKYDCKTDVESLFREISHLIVEFAIPAIDQRITDEQLKNIWFAVFLDVEDLGGVMLKKLAALLLISGEKEKLKTVLNRLSEIIHPESTILSIAYDRIVKAAGLDKEGFNLLGSVNFPPGKNSLSKEELLALYNSDKERFSARFDSEWEILKSKEKVFKQAFSQLIKLVKPFVELQGFTRRGNNFYKRYPQGNIGIISFQKDIDRLGRFYINIGVYSYAAAEFLLATYGEEIKTYPTIIESHWYVCNINSLIPKQSLDYGNLGNYWQYDDKTDVGSLSHEIGHLITKFAIPAIDQRIANQQFHDTLLTELKAEYDEVKKIIAEKLNPPQEVFIQQYNSMMISEEGIHPIKGYQVTTGNEFVVLLRSGEGSKEKWFIKKYLI